MTVTLNRRAFDHARELINEGRIVLDERDAWSEHRPTAEQESEFIRLHGFADYGRWYLGINDEKPEQTKGHYEFPYGDFSKVHRCGVLSAESRAGQYQHYDIENAVAHLHGMLDARKGRAGIEAYTNGFSRKNGAWGPTFGAVTRSSFHRFTTQNTRLNSTLSRRHVISGK